MDLKVEKNGKTTLLSEIGLVVMNIDDSSPSYVAERRVVPGRSGVVNANGRYAEKTISVSGRFAVPTLKDFMYKKDELYGLLLDSEPFYITKMYPESDDVYQYELPGKQTGDIDLLSIPHLEWHYRWKVLNEQDINIVFIGKSSQGLKYDFKVEFVTAELPFGETIPKNVSVSNAGIDYKGTANLNQLEWPYLIELTTTESQSNFYLEINDRSFTYQHSAPLEVGAKLTIGGAETKLGLVNVNNRTNYEHFILKPGMNRIKTDFVGTIKLLNYVELYK